MRRVILNADDFGLTEGVNRAIGELAAAGVLTSATLMASGPACDHAVGIAHMHPQLGVGCHVVLLDGNPVSQPQQVSTLVGRAGSLRDSLAHFVFDLQRGKIHAADIEHEATAQIRKLQAAGIRVTHIDTHKHAHMLPRVLLPLLRAAAACNVHAIRNPFEPSWSTRLTPAPLLRRMQIALLRHACHARFLHMVQHHGLHTTDGTLGIAATGTLTAKTPTALLNHAPPGTWELVLHPGYDDAQLAATRTRLHASREIERRALLAAIPQLTDVQFIRYDELA